MNILRTTFNQCLGIKWVLNIALLVLLVACGGKSTDEDANQPTSSSNLNVQTRMIDASQSVLRKSSNENIGALTTGVSDFVEIGTLNSSGELTHPQPASEFEGTVTITFDAQDDEGIEKIFVAFAKSDFELLICEENCGTSFSAVVTGINPILFDLASGEQTLQVWLEDSEQNLALVDSVNINWQSKVIGGVSASYNFETQSIDVSWNELEGMLRYNVYLATDVALFGRNYLDLDGGEARLALTTNSASFTGKSAGDYFLVVTGVDGSGETAYSDQIQLVHDISQLPVANNDDFTTAEDITLTGSLIINDTAVHGPITLDNSPVSLPTLGSVILSEDGTFVYTPSSNASGSDQFSYEISDSLGFISQAVVNIIITPKNDAPTALADNYTIDGAGSVINIASDSGLLINDTDIDNDTLNVTVTPIIAPTLGVVTLNVDGSFSYIAGDSFVNIDTFTYQVSDPSGLTSEAAVTITTDDFNGLAPVAVSDVFSINEDEILVVGTDESILANDSDGDNDISELVIAIISDTQNGSVDPISTDGTFTYTPLPNFNGTDSFTYEITDPDNNKASATVTINVIAQNDAPTANLNIYIVPADQSFTIPNISGVLENDGDVDGDAITVHLDSVSSPTSGLLDISEFGGFTYTPNSLFTGTDTFTYQVTDGSLLSAATTVQLGVSDVYHATDDVTPIDILDLQTDFTTLNITLGNISAESGSLTIVDDVVVYTPASGFSGHDLITISIPEADGVEAFTIQYYVNVFAANTDALGSHDIDQDNNTDLTISLVNEVTQWELVFDNTNDLVIKEVDGRYYPIEPDNSGEFKAYIYLTDNTDNHVYKVFKNGVYREVTMSDMMNSGAIDINSVAQTPSTNIADLNFPGEYINIKPAPNGTTTFYSASIGGDNYSGETYEFNSGNNGKYISYKEQEFVTWTSTDNVIDVSVNKVVESMSISDMLAEGMITQAAYDNYTVDNSGSDEFDVTVNDFSVQITMDENKLAYLEASEVVTMDYTLPPELGGGTGTTTFSSQSLRLYDKSTLSIYEFAPTDNNGEWLIPVPDDGLDLNSNAVLTEATFNSDNTGTYTRLDTNNVVNFNWAFDSDQRITVETDEHNLTYSFFGDISHAKYVLLERHNASNELTYSNATFVGRRQAVDMTTVKSYLSSGLAINLYLTQNANNYNDSGYFAIDEFMYAYDLSNQLASFDNNTSLYDARSHYVFTDSNAYGINSYWNDYYWSADDSNSTIEINEYVDSSFYPTVCDPDIDTQCFKSNTITWDIVSYDAENNLVWVIEDHKSLDYVYPLVQGNEEYTYHSVSYLNAYTVLPSNNLVNDVATILEDTPLTSFNVLSNDLNSANLFEGLSVVGAYSDYSAGLVVVNSDNTITYTPYENFTGDAEITYIVADELGAISTATLTVTVTDNNDAPVFTSSNITTNSTVEHTTSGTELFFLYTTDEEGDAITWHLAGEGGELTIYEHPTLAIGVVAINDSNFFDYETRTTYEFDVYAMDEHGAVSETQTLTINIQDVDEAPELMLSTSDALVLNENQTGSLGVTATGLDEEGDAFTISWSDPIGIFSSNLDDVNTDEDTLELSVANAIDYETLNSSYSSYDLDSDSTNGVFEYQIEVTVEQDSNSSLYTTQLVTLEITNVDEAPELTGITSVSILENDIGDTGLTATGLDEEGDAFTISWSDPMGIFSSNLDDVNTDEDTLELSVANAIDYETLNSSYSSYDLDSDSTNGVFEYQIEVTIEQDSDSSLSTTQLLTIEISDVVENTELELDMSFGKSGISHFNAYNDTSHPDYLIDAVMDSNNNKYVLVKSFDNDEDRSFYSVVKIDADGTTDSTFGYGGRKQLDPTSLNDDNVKTVDAYIYTTSSQFTLKHIKYDEQYGKIYLLGSFMLNGETTIKAMAMRLNSDGSIDGDFSQSGLYHSGVGVDYDHTEIVDMLIVDTDTDYDIYFALNSTQEVESGEYDRSTFKLRHTDSNGQGYGDGGSYDLVYIDADLGNDNDSTADNDREYITGIALNSTGNIVAFGHVVNVDDVSILISEIDITDLSNANNDNQGLIIDLATGTSDKEYITSYQQLDSTSVLLAGSMTSLSNSDQDPLIAKVNIDTGSIQLDTSFGGDYDSDTVNDGYYTTTAVGTNDDGIISLDIDSSNNINVIIKEESSSNTLLVPLQIDSVGTITSLGNDLLAKELTNTSGYGVSYDSDIEARVFNNDSDATNTIHFVSNLQTVNASGSNEIEVYYETVDPTALPGQFAELSNRNIHEVLPKETYSVEAATLHSSGKIFTVSQKFLYDGYIDTNTLTSHDLASGELVQTFGETSYPGYIHYSTDEYNYLYVEEGKLTELSDGSFMYIDKQIDDYSGVYYLRVHKYDVQGKVETGFPVYHSVSDTFYIHDVHYNATANVVGVFGGYGYDEKSSYSVLINGGDGSANIFWSDDLLSSGQTLGGDVSDQLTSGFVNDDGSAVAIGYADTDSGTITFMIKTTASAVLDPSFDNLDSTGLVIDEEDNNVLEITQDVTTYRLKQLSDGSLVFFGKHNDTGDWGLFKLTSLESAYQLDTHFSSNDDYVKIDPRGIVSDIEQADYTDSVNDMAVDNNDNVYLVGSLEQINDIGVVYYDYGFVAKYSGLDGSADASLGHESLSGYYVPAAVEINGVRCQSAQETNAVDICDITSFDKINIDSSGALIIHSKVESPQNSIDSAILKFNEAANDELPKSQVLYGSF